MYDEDDALVYLHTCTLIQILSKFIKGKIQNDETFAAAAATANYF